MFFPLIIAFLCLFIAFKNYTPGTFLTGWDTLHPEFDFSLNFQRLFFSVWRTEQGLGAVSGHTVMADLPRVVILWLFHFILPLSFLRYSYVFLCLILGPLGFYFLIKYLFKKPYIAFLGAIIYLFNLGTLQQFFVPFEMFTTQWAFLPWIIFSAIVYLHKPARKKLLVFAIINLVATPQAYAAQLWYAFFVVFTVFLILSRSKKALFLLLVTLAVNSFWLIPNIYYLATQTNNPTYNLGNRLHSQEFLLKNQQTGTLADTSLLKGFYFNWDAFDFHQNNFNKLTPAWQNHLDYPIIPIIGNILFLFAFVGLVAVFVTKNRQFLPLTPFFIIPFILLANRMPGFNLLFDLLLKFPVAQEALRFIFTKFSILLTFGFMARKR